MSNDTTWLRLNLNLVNCFLKHLFAWVVRRVVRLTANLALFTFHNVKFLFIFMNNWKQQHGFCVHAHNDSLSLPPSSLKLIRSNFFRVALCLWSHAGFTRYSGPLMESELSTWPESVNGKRALYITARYCTYIHLARLLRG